MTKFWSNASGAIWWPNFELMQVAPFGDQIWNECKWRDLVTKLRTYSSGAICSPNLQPIQVVPLKSILNYSSWKIYSRYGVNTLGPLCLWQCFFSVLCLCLCIFQSWSWLIIWRILIIGFEVFVWDTGQEINIARGTTDPEYWLENLSKSFS